MNAIRLALAIVVLTLVANPVFARVILVPDSQQTIQAGVNAAASGDTILVRPGEYYETVVWSQNSFTLASFYLTTHDPTFINATIIRPDRGRSCIVMRGAGSASHLVGFTLRGARTDYGGGIYLSGASPAIENMVIDSCYASNSGGGVYITQRSRPHLQGLKILNNASGETGGGVSVFSRSHAFLEDVVIRGNQAQVNGGGILISYDDSLSLSNFDISQNSLDTNNAQVAGGGIYMDFESVLDLSDGSITGNLARIGGAIFCQYTLQMNHVVIYDNEAIDSCGAIYGREGTISLINLTVFGNRSTWDNIHLDNPQLTLMNSILWGAEGAEVRLSGNWSPANLISYNIIEDGIQGIDAAGVDTAQSVVNILSDDPQFANAEEGDLHIRANSPALDAGSPDSPPDPDLSRADIGAIPYIAPTTVFGTVRSALTDRPASDALITTSLGVMSVADGNGNYSFSYFQPGEFRLSATAPGFGDTTLTDLNVGVGDTLEVNIHLPTPLLAIPPEGIQIALQVGRTTNAFLPVQNNGNGNLNWNASVDFEGGSCQPPWTRREVIPMANLVQNSQVIAATFDGDRWIIAGWLGLSNLIWVFDRQWRLIREFDQGLNSPQGLMDIKWDGEQIWGVDRDSVWAYSVEGVRLRSLAIPREFDRVYYLAWDPHHELLWLANDSYIAAIDRQGNVIHAAETFRAGRPWTLTWWEGAPHGHYLIGLDAATTDGSVIAFNPDNWQDSLHIGRLRSSPIDTYTSATITSSYDPYGATTYLLSNEPGNQIEIWQITPIPAWMTVMPPTEGTLAPDSVTRVRVLLDASNLKEGEYSGRILFSQNGLRDAAEVSVTLRVEANVVKESHSLPADYSLLTTYPNPFNDRTVVRFGLKTEQRIKLAVFDLAGREVTVLKQQSLSAGEHQVVWNSAGLPSGVYLLRLETPDNVRLVKSLLLK